MSWNRAGGHPKFLFVFDWRVSAFALIWIGHMRWWTLFALALAAAAVTALGYFGYTPSVFYKRIRSTMAGALRASRPWWWRNRYQRSSLSRGS